VKLIGWLLLIASTAGIAFVFWRWRRSEEERKRAAEDRMASFMAQAMPAAHATPAAQATPAVQAMPMATDAGALLKQKLLFEAAAKAGQAGEAVLSIQLYARLLSRYPDSSFAGPARVAVEEQKKKLARP